MPSAIPTYLEEATIPQLLRAVADNHRQFIAHRARQAGGAIYRRNGLTWTDTPGAEGAVEILFPRLSRATAGAELDRLLDYCRERRPLRSVSCWSLLPPRPSDLGVRLVARGFEWGWQPHWMWLNLPAMRPERPHPAGLRIEPAGEDEVWDVQDLPYYKRPSGPRVRIAPRPSRRRFWRFGAWLDGKIVGHSAVYVTTGTARNERKAGVGGIYNCGVVPSARNQGIGRAVTRAACLHALAMGCRYALLNATPMGEPVYRSLGFESMGYGQTWWLHRPTIEAPPPSPAEIAFVEAVGRGDLGALDSLCSRMSPEQLDAPLASGMTAVEVAVKTGQPASADWLARHGATLDVISAWDLGWKERVPELLAASPELVNRRGGNWQITPMHAAVERGDVELARVLLAARPDLSITDAQVGSPPLGWARHFQRTEIIALIEQHQSGQEV